MVKQALEAANIDNTRFTPQAIQAAISKAKNQLMGPERYASQAGDFFSQTVAGIYPVYERRLRDANALDFDDLLYWPALALRHNAELRGELDARFQFVLIDEYQDTNSATVRDRAWPEHRSTESVCRRRSGPKHIRLARLEHS